MFRLVRPDDDDIPEFGGGPPPDPSMRQWRHPSEIAAAAAAAARPAPPSPEDRRRRRALVTALGTGLAATAVVGLGATLVATIGFPSDAIELESEAGSAAAADGSGLEQSAVIVPTALLTTTSTESPTTTISTTSTIAPTTTELPPEPELSVVTVNGVYIGVLPTQQTEPIPDDATSGEGGASPEAEDATPGEDGTPESLWTEPEQDPLRRLGDYVVVNDIILTSASLIKGHDDLHLMVDGQWVPVEVAGRDPLTDLALLQLTEDAPAIDLSGIRLTWVVDGESFDMPGEGASIHINGIEETMEGALVGPKGRVVTATGDPIYSAWLTTVRRPDGSGGAAAIDSNGRLIGLVVNSPDFLASMVSVETMLEVGSALLQWGRPGLEWLGIEGYTAADGGVLVESVEGGGPAALGDLRPGDRIVALNNEAVVEQAHFRFLVRQAGVDASLTVVVIRDGVQLERSVTVGSLQSVTEGG